MEFEYSKLNLMNYFGMVVEQFECEHCLVHLVPAMKTTHFGCGRKVRIMHCLIVREDGSSLAKLEPHVAISCGARFPIV